MLLFSLRDRLLSAYTYADDGRRRMAVGVLARRRSHSAVGVSVAVGVRPHTPTALPSAYECNFFKFFEFFELFSISKFLTQLHTKSLITHLIICQSTYAGQSSRSVTHPQIAPAQARLTFEFLHC